MAFFPEMRLRRLRRTETLRKLVRENHLDAGLLGSEYLVMELGKMTFELYQQSGKNSCLIHPPFFCQIPNTGNCDKLAYIFCPKPIPP